ncbi:hypothetical protein [Candidatus Enterovibrio escicola]|uniref:hypothetical protein n=1 Tax=Candidatus Enterovibrio escicola TaxID=1927127 RepID=UPI001237FB6C|nr:hypothetical protein [Candidatus Enterovibrio escacola]
MPHRYNLIGKDKESCKLFLTICPDFESRCEQEPSDYAFNLYNEYKELGMNNNSMNGAIFELIISTMLIKFNITPFFIQSTVAFVPNVRSDILLYTNEKGPVGLSLKTTLRERYKQADLEAYVLKNVHRNSETFIITASEKEADNVNTKIKNGELLALTKVYDIKQINALISYLETLTIIHPIPVQIITGKEIKCMS